MSLVASDLLNQRLERDKADMDKAYRNEWYATYRRFGPNSNNPRIEAARQRALSNVRQAFRAKADHLLQSYRQKEQGFSEVDQMAKQGMLSADPEEVKMRMILPTEVEKAAYPDQESFEDLETRRGKIRTELNRFEVGRMEGEEFKGEPGEIKTPHVRRPYLPWPLQGRIYEDVPAQGVYVREPYYAFEKGKEVKKIKHRPATPEELRYYAELQQADVSAARLQTAALRSHRMLNRGQGTFAEKAVEQVRSKQPTRQETRVVGGKTYRKTGPDQWELVE